MILGAAIPVRKGCFDASASAHLIYRLARLSPRQGVAAFFEQNVPSNRNPCYESPLDISNPRGISGEEEGTEKQVQAISCIAWRAAEFFI
jgi:hypothetical protein